MKKNVFNTIIGFMIVICVICWGIYFDMRSNVDSSVQEVEKTTTRYIVSDKGVEKVQDDAAAVSVKKAQKRASDYKDKIKNHGRNDNSDNEELSNEVIEGIVSGEKVILSEDGVVSIEDIMIEENAE